MTATTPAPRSALGEPTTNPPGRWIAAITLASIGLWAGFFGPIQVLLAQQAEAISPDDKKVVLAVVLGLGAFVSVVCNPVFGAFSDRTTLRAGRRLPWVAGGAVYHVCDSVSDIQTGSEIQTGTTAQAVEAGKQRLTLKLESELEKCGLPVPENVTEITDALRQIQGGETVTLPAPVWGEGVTPPIEVQDAAPAE